MIRPESDLHVNERIWKQLSHSSLKIGEDT